MSEVHGVPWDPPSARTLRRAMAEFATGVAIVGVKTSAGMRAVTVSTLSCASFDPPVLSVSLHNRLTLLALLSEGSSFSASILPLSRRPLADEYGRPAGSRRRHPSRCEVWEAWGPDHAFVRGSLAWFACSVSRLIPVGDHTLVLATPVAASSSDVGDGGSVRSTALPLVVHRRTYTSISVG